MLTTMIKLAGLLLLVTALTSGVKKCPHNVPGNCRQYCDPFSNRGCGLGHICCRDGCGGSQCICPAGKMQIYCFVDPCYQASCPSIPHARCIADSCDCSRRWFVNGIEVTQYCPQNGISGPAGPFPGPTNGINGPIPFPGPTNGINGPIPFPGPTNGINGPSPFPDPMNGINGPGPFPSPTNGINGPTPLAGPTSGIKGPRPFAGLSVDSVGPGRRTFDRDIIGKKY